MINNYTIKHLSDFSFCKDMFEKYGKLRQFRRGECFVHSGDVMEYVGWTVSGGFKYSLTASNGIDKTIGFALSDSILINYESVMYSKKMQIDLIALEDSEVLVIPSRQIGDILRSDTALNSHLILTLYEQLYDQFLDFYTNSTT